MRPMSDCWKFQITIMAHLVESEAGAANLFAAAAAAMEEDDPSSGISAVTRAAAMVSPTEQEYELLQNKVKELMDEGRGETIMELGVGEDSEGLTEEEMAASVATLKSIADILESDCNQLRVKPCEAGKTTEQWLVRRNSLIRWRGWTPMFC